MEEKLTLIREVIDEVANITLGAEDFAANKTETLSEKPPKKKIVNFRDNVMKVRSSSLNSLEHFLGFTENRRFATLSKGNRKTDSTEGSADFGRHDCRNLFRRQLEGKNCRKVHQN